MKVVSLFLLLSFCAQATSFWPLQKWSFATQITPLASPLEGQLFGINRPFNVWLPLIELTRYADGGFLELKECLLYKVPFRQNLGQLRLIRLRPQQRCQDQASEQAILWELDKISALQIAFSRAKKIQTKEFSLPPFHLYLHFIVQQKSHQLRLKLYNLAALEREGELVQLASIRKIDEISSPGQALPLVGTFADHYEDRSAQFCQRFNNKCEEEVSFVCDRCRFGWYEIAGGQCGEQNDKLCGVDRCGAKGEPACPRGRRYFSHGRAAELIACDLDSPTGFCEKGLVPTCDREKVLVCL